MTRGTLFGVCVVAAGLTVVGIVTGVLPSLHPLTVPAPVRRRVGEQARVRER